MKKLFVLIIFLLTLFNTVNGQIFSKDQYVARATAPSNTKLKWIDRTTYDSTTVFQVKEYSTKDGDWITIGYVDTVNYVFSSQPPICGIITNQSNGVPRQGYTNPLDTTPSPYTTIWHPDGYWSSIHTDQSWMNGIGSPSVWYGLTFGKEAAEKDNRIVKIIYAGLGGQTIDKWLEPNGTQWDTLSQRIADCGCQEIAFIIWYQGETNGWIGTLPLVYSADWFRVMSQFQALPQWHNETKVLAVQINTGEIAGDISGFPRGEMANTIFNNFANDGIEWTYVVHNSDATVIADSSHIDAASTVRLGKRLWDTYTGKTYFNPINKFRSAKAGTLNSGDTISLNLANTVLEIRTPADSVLYIDKYYNFVSGWTGTIRVVNDATVIYPDGQMYCEDTLGAMIQLDTTFSRFSSHAYAKNDSIFLDQCPVDYDSVLSIPLRLGVTAWYSANQETAYYAEGDVVSTLHDFAGNRDFTGSGTPTLKKDAFTGEMYFELTSGGNDYFTRVNTDFSFLHNDTSTVIIVVNPGGDIVANPDSAYVLISSQTNIGSSQLGYSIYYDDRSAFSNNNRVQNLVSNGVTLAVNGSYTSSAPAGQYNYIFCQSDPVTGTAGDRSKTKTNDNIYNNGNSFNNAASGSTTGTINIGRTTTGTFEFTGYIKEIIIFQDKIFTTTELDLLDVYINRNHKITTH